MNDYEVSVKINDKNSVSPKLDTLENALETRKRILENPDYKLTTKSLSKNEHANLLEKLRKDERFYVSLKVDVEERDVLIRRVNYDIGSVTKKIESKCLPVNLGLRLYQGK